MPAVGRAKDRWPDQQARQHQPAMFNALNRFISRLDGDGPAAHRDESQSTFGFQVLRNTNLQLAIEPWFDFVIGINGRMIDDSDPHLFAQEVRNCAGSSVLLGLWSAKGQRARSMHVPVPPDTASLGLALQWTPLSVVSNIWHVLDVPSRSPAETAGLLPYSDYILGTPEGVLHGESGLGELVEDHIGRPLRLWVYNHEYDVTREVTIQPSRDWGGEGALGCVLGYGALHRLPAPLSEPVNGPGETMFDGDADKHHLHAAVIPSTDLFEPAAFAPPPTSPPASSDQPDHFLVPAQLVVPPPPPPPPAGTAAAVLRTKKKDRHHASNAGLSMDDYFKEEEQKSQQLDNAPSPYATPIAPPPKAPPRTVTPKTGDSDVASEEPALE
ncbi:golgi reassembly stacking protein [Grosmannia clavigera kw1407]|uniref:Golgi reassembly stacking protein n=1 Tax=Grosmannia clavigera (strain kw1407 / UAMH 11150) TaxID=655863 RepID=F0X914_GROCL|nr:golgi reassembly stacking protein [Grosmannia clavigera kw1407]EFX05524.1 golgi reassembly stacking protein [Grosmannia clavigera kw1407]